MSSQELYARAVKSSTLSARLSKTESPLDCRSEVIYDLGKLTADLAEPERADHSHFFVYEDIVAFLLKDVLFVLRLGESGHVQEHVQVELAQRSSVGDRVEYQLTDDETSLLIASAGDEFGDTSPIQVHEVSIDPNSFGRTTCHLEVKNIPQSYFMITLRDPYLALVVMEEILIIDWRRKTAVRLQLLPQDPEGYEDLRDYVDQFTTVVFHPTEPLLVAFDSWRAQYQLAGIYLVDIPTDMSALTPEGDASHLTIRQIDSRKLPRPIIPHFHASVFPTGIFPSVSQSSWVLELFIQGRECRDFIPNDPDVEPDDGRGDVEVAQISLDLSEWTTTQPEILSENVIHHYRIDILNMRGNRFFGFTFPTDTVPGERQVIVPKFEDGHGYGTSWARLAIPASIPAAFEVSRYGPIHSPSSEMRSWQSAISCFDKTTGRLFVYLPDGLHVLQY
ncbi:hypothetical protein SISNIDRAFT_550359 [Sistotremastrum niveocremeum HHB9708]|nr:hypothetical protein SISNIDRAFT_550359 [Sistotremastrum niveocremeum HHB9708]